MQELAVAMSAAPGGRTRGRVEDRRDGTYAASYRVMHPGMYWLHVRRVALDGRHEAPDAIPLPVRVSPSYVPLDPDYMSMDRRAARTGGLRAVAGERGRLVLSPRDESGALLRLREGGKTCSARLMHVALAAAAEASTCNGADGKLEVTFRALVAGRYQLWLRWGGVPTAGSPLDMVVLPGPIEPDNCQVGSPCCAAACCARAPPQQHARRDCSPRRTLGRDPERARR
eukprot:6298313-Prymnesium_polylepis.1